MLPRIQAAEYLGCLYFTSFGSPHIIIYIPTRNTYNTALATFAVTSLTRAPQDTTLIINNILIIVLYYYNLIFGYCLFIPLPARIYTRNISIHNTYIQIYIIYTYIGNLGMTVLCVRYNIYYIIETSRALSARNYVPDCLSAAGFVLLYIILYIVRRDGFSVSRIYFNNYN